MTVRALGARALSVTAVEVLAPPKTGGIVAFGDSLTDANISELDANHRWLDQLAAGFADGGLVGTIDRVKYLGSTIRLHKASDGSEVRSIFCGPSATIR